MTSIAISAVLGARLYYVVTDWDEEPDAFGRRVGASRRVRGGRLQAAEQKAAVVGSMSLGARTSEPSPSSMFGGERIFSSEASLRDVH